MFQIEISMALIFNPIRTKKMNLWKFNNSWDHVPLFVIFYFIGKQVNLFVTPYI